MKQLYLILVLLWGSACSRSHAAWSPEDWPAYQSSEEAVRLELEEFLSGKVPAGLLNTPEDSIRNYYEWAIYVDSSGASIESDISGWEGDEIDFPMAYHVFMKGVRERDEKLMTVAAEMGLTISNGQRSFWETVSKNPTTYASGRLPSFH